MDNIETTKDNNETMTDNEAILILLLNECVRRLTHNGKHTIHITNKQLERVYDNDYVVDYSESDADKFVLKLIKNEEAVAVSPKWEGE